MMTPRKTPRAPAVGLLHVLGENGNAKIGILQLQRQRLWLAVVRRRHSHPRHLSYSGRGGPQGDCGVLSLCNLRRSSTNRRYPHHFSERLQPQLSVRGERRCNPPWNGNVAGAREPFQLLQGRRGHLALELGLSRPATLQKRHVIVADNCPRLSVCL